jgi:hypothetical protein
MSKSTQKDIKNDLRRYKDIEAIANQKGGKRVINLLSQDIITAIDTISGNYKELTHTEFIAQGARLSERLALYRLITGAKKNADIVKAILENEIKENGEDTDE